MRVGVVAAARTQTVKMILLAAVVTVAVAVGALAQEGEMECTKKGQCGECIQSPGCVWCINPKDDMKNCQDGATINMTFCDPGDLRNPQNDVTVEEDKELTVRERNGRSRDQPHEEIIQIRPQRVKLRLRKGVPERLTVKFRRALSYPVDLYYLMDLSNSMSDDKENLASLSIQLSETLNNLTDQFTIGFGSFVDKVMMPFTDTSSVMLENPCEGCSSPYAFRNDMKLAKDPEQFRTKVEQAKISGNLDNPEGGFDALMQAMVCKEEIGWRDVARRILVFSTDDKFHIAGDGRLAGVVTPNDEQCHLDNRGEYTAYNKYDYPSISQINKVAKEKNINVIFAVLGHLSLYSKLSERIETSSFGLLTNQSSNVVGLIKQQYESISSEVTLTDNSTEDVSIVYSSACKGGPVLETNKCGGVHENEEVTFLLEITANQCPADGKGYTVEVKTLEDRVILDLEFHCSCDCPPDNDISKCKGRGKVVCGVCDCDEDYYGEKCQCGGDESSFAFREEQNKNCKANEQDTRLCSGRGTCKCGECKCRDANVTGQFCQCDRRKCSLGMGAECSGHGVCKCDKCECHDGFAGNLCECPDEKACIHPGSEEVCSGHGKCECGNCKCDSHGNDTYTGKYCEDCLQCGTGKCSQFKDCVLCQHFQIGPRKGDCDSCVKSTLVDSLDEQMLMGARLCTIDDETGCYVNFTYRYLETEPKEHLFVQSERQCQEPPPIMSIVFSLIGAIVALGILTLFIWKIVTTLHDRREYAKFEEESRNARFNTEENPLYVDVNTTVENPVFGSQKY